MINLDSYLVLAAFEAIVFVAVIIKVNNAHSAALVDKDNRINNLDKKLWTKSENIYNLKNDLNVLSEAVLRIKEELSYETICNISADSIKIFLDAYTRINKDVI